MGRVGRVNYWRRGHILKMSAPGAGAGGLVGGGRGNYLNTVELLPDADNYLYDGDGSVALRPGMMTIAHGGAPQRALADRARVVAEVKAAREKAASR